MRLSAVSLIVVAILLSIGCASPEWPRERRNTMNRWMVEDYQGQMTDDAIVAGHTLYPYHFVANGAQLNELGVRDLAVLAHHYRGNPGRLNIRHNGTPDDLYEARVDTVVAALIDAGVDTDRVSIDDGLPGGDGMSSEFVVKILDLKMDSPLNPDSAASGTILSNRGNSSAAN